VPLGGPATPSVASVLDLDADLCAAIPPSELEPARLALRERVIWVEPGDWEPPLPPASPRFVGFLLVEGVIARDVALAGMGCTELLAPGDVLRPADQAAAYPSVPFEVAFRVDQRARLVVLGDRFASGLARWPQLAAELMRRTVRRSQSLGMHLAITCLTGTDLRLHVLFWHLADRFGTVESDGVVVPLRLTHDMLGRLVRGRRPAVSTALKALAERDAVHRRPDGAWLLRGGPPDAATVVARSHAHAGEASAGGNGG
jgi:CRP/FNR family cyclic AMP-dependent transcriptional regulator